MNTAQIIDIVILGICLFFAVRALFRGLVVELFSLLAFIGGYWGSRAFGPIIGTWFEKFASVQVSTIIGYTIAFLSTYILIKIIERLLSRLMHVILLGGLNRLFGFLFGLLEGSIIIAIVVSVLLSQTIVQVDFEALFADSVFLKYINLFINMGLELLGKSV